MKLLFFTDPHYSSEQIPTRKDNYPDVMLDKTRQVLELSEKLGIDLLICGGDFCHIKKFSMGYLNKLLMLFRSYSVNKACCIGNHDTWYGRPETVERSPLGVMFTSNTFLPKPGEWTIETEDTFILFLPFMTDELPPIHMHSTKKLILVGHYYHNRPEFKENIPVEYMDQFDYVLLGHDHEAFPIERVGKAQVVRPGALSRGTRNKSSLVRPIQVAYIDTETGECKYIPLVYKPAEEVFSLQRMNREQTIRQSSLVDELNKNVSAASSEDVLGILEKMELEPKVKENTKYWLVEGGII
jgi:DNA repair exonuclease SbcCD nuclease subunit